MSRLFLWVLFVLLALSFRPAQAMEGEDYFSKVPTVIKKIIFQKVFFEEKNENNQLSFTKIGRRLVGVSKGWKEIIRESVKEWISEYYDIEKKNQDVFWKFFKGKLVYKQNLKNNEERMVLLISELSNPLEGLFDLSKCGNTGEYLSISTGYPKKRKPENFGKVEIWFTPRFLVERELNTTAQHLQAIFPDNWPQTAPVGILWTSGMWTSGMFFVGGWYNYLTTQCMDELENSSLYNKEKKAIKHRQPAYVMLPIPDNTGNGSLTLYGNESTSERQSDGFHIVFSN